MTTTIEDMKAEVDAAIYEAIETNDYKTLYRLANAFAANDDMETANWLLEHAEIAEATRKSADDEYWSYDRSINN